MLYALFGACIGAIMYKLFAHEEYFHVILAVVAVFIFFFLLGR